MNKEIEGEVVGWSFLWFWLNSLEWKSINDVSFAD